MTLWARLRVAEVATPWEGKGQFSRNSLVLHRWLTFPCFRRTVLKMLCQEYPTFYLYFVSEESGPAFQVLLKNMGLLERFVSHFWEETTTGILKAKVRCPIDEANFKGFSSYLPFIYENTIKWIGEYFANRQILILNSLWSWIYILDCVLLWKTGICRNTGW